MYVPLWLIVVVLAVALVAYVFFLQGRGGEMIERQRRATPPPLADRQAVLNSPEVRAAIAQGRKIEAIKLVRERTGLGLKEARDLLEK